MTGERFSGRLDCYSFLRRFGNYDSITVISCIITTIVVSVGQRLVGTDMLSGITQRNTQCGGATETENSDAGGTTE